MDEMKIRLRICTETGWETAVIIVPKGTDDEYYVLPKGTDRLAFWEEKSGVSLPRGRTWLWEPIEDDA
jgi:hypothetical protein